MNGINSSTYPGIPTIVDGSEAVAYVETRVSEGCCAYPITPSTTMAAIYQAAVADGKSNLWVGSRAFPLFTYDFVEFARSESRFAQQFAADGTPSDEIRATGADRLANWHTLQEMAGLSTSG